MEAFLARTQGEYIEAYCSFVKKLVEEPLSFPFNVRGMDEMITLSQIL